MQRADTPFNLVDDHGEIQSRHACREQHPQVQPNPNSLPRWCAAGCRAPGAAGATGLGLALAVLLAFLVARGARPLEPGRPQDLDSQKSLVL